MNVTMAVLLLIVIAFVLIAIVSSRKACKKCRSEIEEERVKIIERAYRSADIFVALARSQRDCAMDWSDKSEEEIKHLKEENAKYRELMGKGAG